MLKSEAPLNGEHHANLGPDLKRKALILAKALDTDLNGVLKRATSQMIETYEKANPGSWKALLKEFSPHEGKGGKKVKKV